MITITRVEGKFDLHAHYRSQTDAQPTQLCLDCDARRMWCEYNAEIGNAVPVTVWHGRQLVWSIPLLLADAANRLLDEALPLAERIVAGYECVWDGSNYKGRYNDDARAACDEMERLCNDYGTDDDRIEVWDAYDWFAGVERDTLRDEFGITAKTTDEQLDEIEREINESADTPANVLVEGVDNYLRELRDELTDNEE